MVLLPISFSLTAVVRCVIELWHEQNTNFSLTDCVFTDRPKAMECELGLVDMTFLCPLEPDSLADPPRPLLLQIDLLLSRRPRRRETAGAQASFL